MKPVAAAFLLLIMLLFCSTALGGRRLGGRRLPSSSYVSYDQSELKNQVLDLQKLVSDLEDQVQVLDLKNQVSDLKKQVSNMKDLDHDHGQVSDWKKDDQVSELKNQVSDLKKQFLDLKEDHDQVLDLKKQVSDLKMQVSNITNLDHDKVSDSKKDKEEFSYLPYVLFPAFVFVFILIFLSEQHGHKLFDNSQSEINVLRLQVGFFGLIKLLQTDLNKPKENKLTETIKALLQQLSFNNCIIYAHSSIKSRMMYNWYNKFDILSDEESLKFKGETLVKVHKWWQDRSEKLKTISGNFEDEYIVVTFLMAVKGEYKLPSVHNTQDLKEALQKLASIPSTSIKGLEIMWTPQLQNYELSERDFLGDFPVLQLIK